MALQVAGGVACCFPPPLPGGGRRHRQPRSAAALGRPARAVASTGAAAKVVEEGEGKVRLGESGVAVTKLGIGAWSWGDTTYWNDSEWDGTRVPLLLHMIPAAHASRVHTRAACSIARKATVPARLLLHVTCTDVAASTKTKLSCMFVPMISAILCNHN
jgi:hypothetical protein